MKGSLLLSWAKQRDGSYDYTKKLVLLALIDALGDPSQFAF